MSNRNSFTAKLEGRTSSKQNHDAQMPRMFDYRARQLATDPPIPPLQRDIEEETTSASFEIPSTLLDAMTGLLTHENISPDVFITKLIQEGIKELVANPKFVTQLRSR